MDEDGHRSGYSYEVLQRIAQHENVQFEYLAYDCDANEAADMLERGEIDLLPTLRKTDERAERFAGESKYPLKKMIAFAADGITSFSVKPIRLVFSTGVVVFIVSLIMLIYALVAKLAGHTSVGWTSLMGSIWLIGGIQLLGLGVVGEYIGKIYNETKRRPRFIIESVLNKADNE